MMNETNVKKMEELLANGEFAQKIVDAGSLENAYLLFAEQGLDVSYEVFFRYIQDNLKHMEMLSENGELDVEQLDSVVGSGKCTYDSVFHKWIWKFFQYVGLADKNSCPASQY